MHEGFGTVHWASVDANEEPVHEAVEELGEEDQVHRYDALVAGVDFGVADLHLLGSAGHALGVQ